jgi:hypothetical protein
VTLVDDLLPIAYEKRALAGQFGIRLYTVALVVEKWTGQHTGEGVRYEEYTPITEANDQPPKVEWVTDEEVALGAVSGSIKVGPITPLHATGGTDLEPIIEQLEAGSTRHIQIVGPKHPAGVRYSITNIEVKPLHYLIRASAPASRGGA